MLHIYQLFYQVRVVEGNLVKSIFGLCNRCKTTPLFHALNIAHTLMRPKELRIEFFKRALCNEYTRYLCLNIKSKGSICCDIRELINLKEETLSGIVESCKLEELLMRDEIRSEKENNPYIKSVKEIFNSKDKTLITQRLFYTFAVIANLK
ncbi:unnamed protein product [Brachionus calyciflorus]|uniref:Uncharacterized protein n=1 Tax=Brachionus calyciflorus TaxID=104777 RepID=A0A814S3M5_9BILA|nr:unnamed protein product [Brachionus calyciflorus]